MELRSYYVGGMVLFRLISCRERSRGRCEGSDGTNRTCRGFTSVGDLLYLFGSR